MKQIVVLVLCFIAFCQTLHLLRKSTSPGRPAILVPGDGGSQMWAKLINKPSVVHYFCEKHTDSWFNIWLNLELMVPYMIGCWTDNIRLVYNTTTHRSYNSPGVAIKTTEWGNTSTVEWLDPSKASAGHYFATIVQNALKWGYRRGKDIRGAPFDFRRAPSELGDTLEKLQKLIEETYYANGNKKVVIIGHSLGNPTMLYFYNHQSQAWKDKFIHSHISICGPWGGSIKILKVYASGYNFGHYSILLPPLKIRAMQRSLTSSAFLMPSDKFWGGDEVLVSTPTRNYTVYDYKQFFDDIKFPLGWDMYQQFGKLTYDMTPPGVEVHCLYGRNLSTPGQFIYGKGQFPDTQPQEKFVDGDGTVTVRSALGCLRWKGKQKQRIFTKSFPGQEHLDILKSPDLVEYVKKVLYS